MQEISAPPVLEFDRVGFADLLWEKTKKLHVQAERSGVLGDLLKGRATLGGYVLLLRNLLPAYEELETGLRAHRNRPAMRGIARPEVYRAEALKSDLDALCGAEWRQSIPLLATGRRYAEEIAMAARRDGTRLLAHAYARYLGDLNGGRILKRLLARSLDLEPCALSFYDFSGIEDLEAFKAEYRAAVDASAAVIKERQPIIREAERAFRLNIRLSNEIQRVAANPCVALQA